MLHKSRYRAIAFVVGVAMPLVALLGAPLATAQVPGSNSPALARASPTVASPGSIVQVTFVIPPPALVQADVQGRVTCAISGPAPVEGTACGANDSLVSVYVLGSGAREYVVNLTAPQALGNYTVAFHYTTTLSIPGDDANAATQFVVAPGAAPGNAGDGGGSSSPGSTPIAQNSVAPGPTALDRWGVLGTIAAAGSILTLASLRMKKGGL